MHSAEILYLHLKIKISKLFSVPEICLIRLAFGCVLTLICIRSTYSEVKKAELVILN